MGKGTNRTTAPWRAMSIRVRLAIAFGTLIVLLAAMAGVGAWRLAQLSAVTSELATVHLKTERVVGEWLSHTRSNAVRAVVLTQSDDPELRRLLTPALEATSKRINELQQEVEGLLDSPQTRAQFAEVGTRRAAYLDLRKSVLEAKKAGEHQRAAQLLEGSMLPAVETYVNSIQSLANEVVQEVQQDAAMVAATAATGRKLLAAFCAGGVLFALLAALLITRSITEPVREAVAAARRVAAGDLTMHIDSDARDEMGQLLRALGEMSERLRQLVSEVADGARTVADTSAQIAQGNADLSQRTEEQASTLEETASSMEELTSTVGQNADNARQANELAMAATQVAREGGTAVGQVVHTMDGISAASKKIAEIIGVIDGIAFQTNILALNAAVEAARAGDQGRGFAVVASEVRNLAQRSAQAAKEIKTLIGDSVRQVEAGAGQVADAGRKMDHIVASVQKVGALIAEIAAASQEQSDGIEQVNVAITQMDQVVQQNASLVEEAAAATESMKGQAAALLQGVSRFRLADTASAEIVVARAARVVPLPPAAEAKAVDALPAWKAPAPRVANGEWREF
ncbi:MAG TPA: methyl-accepting chemotaxis protein [Ramlibacter sp.]